MMKSDQSSEIIWAIPCLNEEIAIGNVIARIKASCPGARIIVFDNASTDGTIAVALAAGAEVRREANRGKGNVVRRIFRDCNSNVVIMIDGDNTNDVEAWESLVGPVFSGAADMVIGCRLDQSEEGAFRPMHHAGNLILGLLMRGFFKLPVRDVLSGYRAFSRRMYKAMPVEASGFEIETEMTLKAVEMKWSVAEVPTRYACRPAGSHSKLRTFHDGLIIGFAIFRVLKDSKPFTFFGAIALANFAAALVALNMNATVFAAFLAFAGIMSGATGVVLNAVSQRAKELMQILAMRE
jgi:glycosyltransferase involved in cell wall biosynthesis